MNLKEKIIFSFEKHLSFKTLKIYMDYKNESIFKTRKNLEPLTIQKLYHSIEHRILYKFGGGGVSVFKEWDNTRKDPFFSENLKNII